MNNSEEKIPEAVKQIISLQKTAISYRLNPQRCELGITKILYRLCCSECGDDLVVVSTGINCDGDLKSRVSPCESCLKIKESGGVSDEYREIDKTTTPVKWKYRGCWIEEK